MYASARARMSVRIGGTRLLRRGGFEDRRGHGHGGSHERPQLGRVHRGAMARE
jgi:hypothetical protein